MQYIWGSVAKLGNPWWEYFRFRPYWIPENQCLGQMGRAHCRMWVMQGPNTLWLTMCCRWHQTQQCTHCICLEHILSWPGWYLGRKAGDKANKWGSKEYAGDRCHLAAGHILEREEHTEEMVQDRFKVAAIYVIKSLLFMFLCMIWPFFNILKSEQSSPISLQQDQPDLTVWGESTWILKGAQSYWSLFW